MRRDGTHFLTFAISIAWFKKKRCVTINKILYFGTDTNQLKNIWEGGVLLAVFLEDSCYSYVK